MAIISRSLSFLSSRALRVLCPTVSAIGGRVSVYKRSVPAPAGGVGGVRERASDGVAPVYY